MPLPEPQSALHQRLEKVADNIARLGQPRAEVIAFYMCGFKSNGNREPRKNNIVAQWLCDAQIGSVEAIAEMNAEAFLALMMDTRPPHDPPLVRKIDGHDLLAIHAAAAGILAATEAP